MLVAGGVMLVSGADLSKGSPLGVKNPIDSYNWVSEWVSENFEALRSGEELEVLFVGDHLWWRVEEFKKAIAKRFPSPWDVTTNTAGKPGGVVGFRAGVSWDRWKRRQLWDGCEIVCKDSRGDNILLWGYYVDSRDCLLCRETFSYNMRADLKATDYFGGADWVKRVDPHNPAYNRFNNEVHSRYRVRADEQLQHDRAEWERYYNMLRYEGEPRKPFYDEGMPDIVLEPILVEVHGSKAALDAARPLPSNWKAIETDSLTFPLLVP